MAVGAQSDLGGQQTFARKMTFDALRFSVKIEMVFSAQIEVFSKKKKSLNGFSVQMKVFSKKKKKKKGLHRNWDGILVVVCPNIQTIRPNK